MIISKNKIGKMFFDYTKVIYAELGRKLSAKQEMQLKARINKHIEKYTIKNAIKDAANDAREKTANHFIKSKDYKKYLNDKAKNDNKQ